MQKPLLLFAASLFLLGCPAPIRTVTQNLILVTDAGDFASTEQVQADFEYAFPENPLFSISQSDNGLLTLSYEMAISDPRTVLITSDPKSYFGAAYGFENLTYQLLVDETSTPSTLTLRSDNTFSFDFNLCDAMVMSEGTYTSDGESYTLDVTSCTDCDESAISTVSMNLKEISPTQLEVQGDVLRVENGQEYGFCGPNSDYKVLELL